MKAVFNLALVRYTLAVLLFAGIWKLVSLGLDAVVLPSPETALAAFSQALKTPLFWSHFGISAGRIASAMALGWLVAFPLGIIMGYNPRVDAVLGPMVFLTYPVPKIVLLPIFLLLFGLGDFTKILMIALITGYQILVATRDGVHGLDKKYFDAFASIGGNWSQALRHVLIPAALPHGFTALRIGTGAGIAVLFFVESFATHRGLGFLIMDSWGRFDYEGMFTGIIGMSLLGVLLYEVFNYMEKKICEWKTVQAGSTAAAPPLPAFWTRILVFGRMIKFSHTIFALPFALAAVVLAQREYPLSWSLLFWILVAMVGARSAAMGFNRIADAKFDAGNPRTAQRAIPAGQISMAGAVGFVLFFAALFVLAAAMISRLCLILALPVLGVLCAYSLTKRFTSLSHLYLGFAISLAPIGAWIAVTGGFDPAVLPLSLALLTYIAGFDIIYSCQDLTCDLDQGLFSIPARFGTRTALHISTLLHVIAFGCFFLLLIVFDLGAVYGLTLGIIGLLLILEHRLVQPDNLDHIHLAFFHVNSAISVILFGVILLDELLRGGL